MIVKYKDEESLIYLNIDRVESFGNEFPKIIRFQFKHDRYDVKFKSSDDRDKALERLDDYIRFQRMMCDLTDFAQ
jgi:hypothetical protein